MEHVFGWAKARYGPDATVIAVGDFNAGCGYASEEELDALPIHGEAYDWVVPHSADTNLADSTCAYDRIVVAAPEGTDLVDEWGVDRAFEGRNVSDHWPVWANLRFAP
jgi:endonuclease/exonuclease/phosphatase family metal-dependent hydrolase